MTFYDRVKYEAADQEKRGKPTESHGGNRSRQALNNTRS